MRILLGLLLLSAGAPAQVTGDPCREFAQPGGWLVTLKVTGNGSSSPGTPPYSRKFDLLRTATITAPLTQLREESSIFGRNGGSDSGSLRRTRNYFRARGRSRVRLILRQAGSL
jgi:hypothetical protein